MLKLFKFKKNRESTTKPEPEHTAVNESFFANSEYFIDGKPVTAQEYADFLAQHDDVSQINDDYGLSYDGTPETECFADEDE